MRYRQIVFDVDGTLVDTEQAVICSLQDTLAQMTGQRAEAKELTFALGIPGEDALRLLQVRDIPAALALWDQRMEAYRDMIRVFEGVEELLRDFDCVVCADDTVRHKPDSEPLLYYLEQTGCQGDELLYIGDSVYDRQCAAGAGTAFGLAGWGAQPGVSAPLIFSTPQQAAQILIG